MTDRPAASARHPWVLIALLWGVAFLNSADRSILVAVMPQLRSEFGLTPTQLALLSSVFFWIYAAGACFAGRLGDSVRRTRVVLYGLIFWSVATGASSLASGFAMLLAFRGLVAVGESTYYPTATALIGDWHRPEMRSRALSSPDRGIARRPCAVGPRSGSAGRRPSRSSASPPVYAVLLSRMPATRAVAPRRREG